MKRAFSYSGGYNCKTGDLSNRGGLLNPVTTLCHSSSFSTPAQMSVLLPCSSVQCAPRIALVVPVTSFV